MFDVFIFVFKHSLKADNDKYFLEWKQIFGVLANGNWMESRCYQLVVFSDQMNVYRQGQGWVHKRGGGGR